MFEEPFTPILDACCGGRMFWFDKNNPNVTFADIRRENVLFKDGNKIRSLSIEPQFIHDFTQMSYPDNTFKLVIFDPPHLIKGGDNSWLVKKYGLLNPDWSTQLRKGFDECMRVLDNFGTLVFKWNETQIPVSKIIEMLGQQPLLGHKSGRAAQTHWLLFMKLPNHK